MESLKAIYEYERENGGIILVAAAKTHSKLVEDLACIRQPQRRVMNVRLIIVL